MQATSLRKPAAKPSAMIHELVHKAVGLGHGAPYLWSQQLLLKTWDLGLSFRLVQGCDRGQRFHVMLQDRAWGLVQHEGLRAWGHKLGHPIVPSPTI